MLRLFLSTVTDRNAAQQSLSDPLRDEIAARLKQAKIVCVYQECIPERGVNTLVKIAAVIKKECDYVIHVMGINRGATPPPEVVAELWRHIPKAEFQARFPCLFQHLDDSIGSPVEHLTYTEWEAWIAKFYDRPLFCCCHASIYGGGSTVSDELPPHFRLLKPFAGYPETYDSDDELFGKISVHLLGEMISRRDSGSQNGSALSWPNITTPSQSSISNRDAELNLLLDLISPNRLERVLLLYGPSSRGKSSLIAEFQRQLSNIGSVSYARGDFKGGASLVEILGAIWDALDHSLQFGTKPLERDMGVELLQNIEGADRPVLLLLDTYEEAIPECIYWVEEGLLPFVGRSEGIRLVVTGHHVPKPPRNWQDVEVQCHEIFPICDPRYWIKYQNEVALRSASDQEIMTQVELAKGDPSLIDAWLLAQPEAGK